MTTPAAPAPMPTCASNAEERSRATNLVTGVADANMDRVPELY
ncbi:MAG: hypothetical protein RI601_12920 [Desulfurivibrionaceae bacterium]|nr:hypothetical protein [Desulfurivibrionaceae bacterium]